MSKNLEVKKQLVEDIAKDLKADKESVSTVVFEYTGIGVNEINELRAKLAEHGAKLTVVKNTLIKRILEKTGVEIEEDLQGQSALLIPSTEDIVTPIKEIFEYIKASEKGQVKLGVLEGALISQSQVEALAKLPSREVLIGQVVGGFVSPIRGFVYTLNGVQGNLVRVLSAIKDQKGN